MGEGAAKKLGKGANVFYGWSLSPHILSLILAEVAIF